MKTIDFAAFGIGSMVYSGLEFGQYFELKESAKCRNVTRALTPAARMLLTLVQMQFIFLSNPVKLMDTGYGGINLPLTSAYKDIARTDTSRPRTKESLRMTYLDLRLLN